MESEQDIRPGIKPGDVLIALENPDWYCNILDLNKTYIVQNDDYLHYVREDKCGHPTKGWWVHFIDTHDSYHIRYLKKISECTKIERIVYGLDLSD
jgi:hypothetical protein